MAQPQSRAEAIVQATIDGETWNGIPQSRLERLLMELNQGGGTTNYEALENLPTINGSEIKGEVADDILELVEPLSESDVQDLEEIISDDPNE